MSFMDIFGSKPAAAPAPAPVPTPAPATGDEGIKAGAPSPAPAPASPLDQFKGLFDTDEEGKGKKEPTNPFALDVDKVKQNANAVDFTKSISDETLQKIRAGGEEGQMAFLQAMNEMSRSNYAYSVMLAAKMSEQAMSTVMERVNNLVPDLVRKMRTNEEFGDNPALTHPAARPLVEALVIQFAEKHPDKSPKQIRQMAQDYVVAFSKAFQTEETTGLLDKTKNDKKAPGEYDWSNFLTQ